MLGVDLASMDLSLFSFHEILRQAIQLQYVACANHDRLAHGPHPLVERGLDRDLGADAAGIAHRDGYFWFFNRRSRRGYTRRALPSKIFCLSETLKSSSST